VQEISDLPAMTLTEVLSRLLSVLLLIAINAFFVAAEFSMVTVRRSRINQLVDGGDVAAQTVQSLQQSIERLLSTMQLGITVSSLALGWIGESTIAVLVRMSIGYLPLPTYIKSGIAHSFSISIVNFFVASLPANRTRRTLSQICSVTVFRTASENFRASEFIDCPFVQPLCVVSQSIHSIALAVCGHRIRPKASAGYSRRTAINYSYLQRIKRLGSRKARIAQQRV
jgi:Hemolysins and related proteins containing CBS domains